MNDTLYGLNSVLKEIKNQKTEKTKAGKTEEDKSSVNHLLVH